MCYSYMHQSQVQVRVARIFNTFGPRMHPNDGRVVSNFIVQALKGEPLTVYGTGEQTRSFQYVRDLVIGLVKLMNSDLSEPCNLGNPEETSIIEFAQRIKSMLGSTQAIVHKPPAPDDPSKRKPDISRAKKEIGWEPKTSVGDGLAYTVEYFKQELSMSKEHTEIWLDQGVLEDVL
jgi:UDP-glucuronate decarboxylase